MHLASWRFFDKQKKGENSLNEKLRKFLLALSIAAFAFCAVKLTNTGYMYYKMDKDLSDIKEKAITKDPEKKAKTQKQEDDAALKRHINWSYLKGINKDIFAWIYVPGTAIDYPMLKGATNYTYIRHNYRKQYSYNGSIFIEHVNSKKMTDDNTIVYGHNMRNGSMFATMNRFYEQSFMNKHHKVYIYFPSQKVNVYDIFSYSVIKDTNSLYKIDVKDYPGFIRQIYSTSRSKLKTDTKHKKPLLMMSTCYTHNTPYRRVLFSRLEKTAHVK